MQKLFWQALLISPAILIGGCVIPTSALAQDVRESVELPSRNSQEEAIDLGTELMGFTASIPSLDSINRQQVSTKFLKDEAKTPAASASHPGEPINPQSVPAKAVKNETIAQVTPVSQLSGEPINPQPVPMKNSGMAQVTPVSQLSGEATNSEPVPVKKGGMAQVTSVSQLSDVQPTDWAFQALQSLVERYGCIEGYPDRTYRGNRALTRYEFAAGLNSCLNRIQELIAAAGGGGVTQEDIESLRRLQEQFKAELSTLRGRVDTLEARTARLEAQQFSTTTKLNGFVSFNITNATIGGGDRVRAEGFNAFATQRLPNGIPFVRTENNPETTFSYLAWLTFNTSFTGKDTLVTRIGAGNGFSPANALVSAGQFNTTGTPFLDQTVGPTENDVVIAELFYSFPVGEKLRVTVGPRVNFYRHFDGNPFTIPINGASTFNSINSTFLTYTKRGSGAVVEWNLSKQFEFRAGYLVENIEFFSGNRPPSDPNRGLFNGADTITAELTFKPSRTAKIRLLYQRSNLPQNQNGQIAFQPVVGTADDGFGGRVHDATSDTFGVNLSWLITKHFGIFGRYYYSSTHLDPISDGRDEGDLNAQNIQAGLAFPDLGKPGALATVSFVIPYDVLDGREFLVAGGGNGGTQYDIELNYFYPISPNIAIVPAFYIIQNMNNFDDNPTVFIGNLRTEFRF